MSKRYAVYSFEGVIKARWLSWLERRPVTAEVVGSSPIWVVSADHVCWMKYLLCWCGGTGRRPGLKILWVVTPVPVRFRLPAFKKENY